MLFRLATSILSPGGARGRLSAFIFHRVPAEPDALLPGEPHAAEFDRILGWIGSQFRVLPPLEACERLFARSLPPRAAIITFDDGYRDNHDVALPILLKHRMPAAFFIATGYLDGGVMFNDRVIEAVRGARDGCYRLELDDLDQVDLSDLVSRRSAIDSILRAVKHLPGGGRDGTVSQIEARLGSGVVASPMMGSEQVKRLRAAGMEIGGHTRSHPILAMLDPIEAATEVAGGRHDLASLLGESPKLFAYPNGRFGADWSEEHAAMVLAAGYGFAFSTEVGAAHTDSNPMALPRFTPWERTRVWFGLRSLRSLIVRTERYVAGKQVSVPEHA